MTIRLAVLVSGSGTTLQNLLDRIAAGTLDARVEAVVSNSRDAFALERARRASIPAVVVTGGKSLPEFTSAIFAPCRQHAVDLVVMGGFLKLVRVPDDFLGRVINIHPALIPSFCGKGYYGERVHQAVLDRGVKVSGCTVHFVDNEYDHGPIILQRAVPVAEDDTADTLAQRVFAAECDALPEAIQLFAEGRLRIEGQRVRVQDESEKRR